MNRHHQLLRRFVIPWSILILGSSLSGNIASPAVSDLQREALDLLKTRTVGLLRGGDSTGAYRMQVTEASDRWCRVFMEEPYRPIERIESDPVGTTELTNHRSGQLRRLAFASCDPHGSLYQSPAVLNRLSVGLEDVLSMFQTNAAKEGNWHSWMISIPRNLGAIGLMLEGALPPGLLDRLVAAMSSRLERMVLTGANASWEARNHIYLALLTDDVPRLAEAARRVFVDVRYGSDSGVREDYAYLFHGRIPYAGVYGAGFAQTVSQFVYLLADTPWAAADEKTDLITNLLLEHSQWFMLGERLDRTVLGRRYEVGVTSGQLLEAMLFLSHSGVSRAPEIGRAAKAQILAGAVPTETTASWADELMVSGLSPQPPRGFRFWPSAEVGAYRGDGFRLGFRQYSRRVQDYEYLILQGAEGWNLAMGAVDLLRVDGSGYWYDGDGLLNDIEMEFLPNVTSRQGANPINPTDKFSGNSGWSMNYGTAEFSGGCGWNDGGVAGFVLRPSYGGIVARKTLHFFNQGYWALGSGISITEEAAESSGTVRTNLIQWPTGRANLELLISGDRVLAVSETDELIEDASWLWIDGVAVVFTEPTDVWCHRRGGVVTLWLDHGINPSDESYAYAVLPASDLEQVKAFSATPTFAPNRMNGVVHAVRDASGSRRSLVFFDSGACEGIVVDHPAMVFLRSDTDGSILAVQNPLHTDRTIHLEVEMVGDLSGRDPAVSVEDPLEGAFRRIAVETTLGRIYRLGSGKLGESVVPVPREDLSDLHRFAAAAESTLDETLLTLRMPISWKSSGHRISIHGQLGHHLATLTDEDLIEELPGNRVLCRWDRALPTADVGSNRNLLQRSGDFRIWYETDLQLAIDYFSVPLFDQEGNVVPDPDYRADMNNPYRVSQKSSQENH